jgi:hypothetical protein
MTMSNLQDEVPELVKPPKKRSKKSLTTATPMAANAKEVVAMIRQMLNG